VDPAGVRVTYNKNGGANTTVNMTPQGGDMYSGNIPGPASLGDVFNYYISARDVADIPNHGRDPAVGTHSFEIVDYFAWDFEGDDGGFTDARYAYWPDTEITPNTWIAITAIACTALLQFRDVDPSRVDPAAVDAALARGEAFLMDPMRLNRGDNEDSYADTYRLIYFARRAARFAESRELAFDAMEQVVAAARKRQSENGFFAHEYENAFCTGAMLWGLAAAADAGVDVPPEMFSKGIAAIVSKGTAMGPITTPIGEKRWKW